MVSVIQALALAGCVLMVAAACATLLWQFWNDVFS